MTEPAKKQDEIAEAASAAAGAPPDVAERRAATRKEYSQYVAAEPIYHDGALAFNVGDPVPAANVKAHKYDQTDPPLVKRAK